jgi:hypothetical protein
MTPFKFGSDKARNVAELERFAACCAKPAGLNDEYGKRLDFYLHRQRPHILQALTKLYPKTHQDIAPYLETLRITRFFVDEQAKVFLNGAALSLAGKDGKPLAADDKRAKRWTDLQREMALGLRLKLTDRYANLNRVSFLRFGMAQDRPMQAAIFLPQFVDVAWDPDFPGDLDMAYGVRLRVGGEKPSELVDKDKKPVSKGFRYEFWCARKDAEQYQIVWDDGSVDVVPGNPEGKLPYRDEQGQGIVPLVMFALHTEELGFFNDSECGLWQFNEAVDLAVTDLNHIATVQGFGQLVISYKSGMAPTHSEIVVGPTRALELKDDATAQILSPAAQISALLDKVDRSIRRQANLHGIPPGAVSLEGRQAPSGIALQIEMRPLLEQRTDAIDLYRGSMDRAWKVIRIVHDARSQEKFGTDVEAKWEPGEVGLPTDEAQQLENVLTRYKNRMSTRAEAIAEDRGISIEEAQKKAKEIDAERGAEPARESLDVEERMRRLREGAPPAGEPVDPEEPEEPEPVEE